ncbi:MAG: glycosidase [Candidatus Eremiobacteraeota bacterium]|nr:glycosidase [Candidatus Eremiobacteraeota bacterium]
MLAHATIDPEVRVQRLGTVLEPNGDPSEAEGTLNPACARTRDGQLLLYPRDVAQGNISRVGLVRAKPKGDGYDFRRAGFALEPDAPYELRAHPGYGCEDPRVTFVAELDKYVMAYTAFGGNGPRIALALSDDGTQWSRLGLLRFDKPGMHVGDDKDAAFFPESVLSPAGVRSLAFYHRPMLHLSAVDGRAAIPMIERMPFVDRESIRIGYIPLEPALESIENLLDVCESELVMSPNAQWGSLKLGAGTPPVRIAEGWMSLYHAVDAIDETAVKPKLRYSAGIMIHDLNQPHHIVYRSPQPILAPELETERRGIVDNVVFPTGIDPRPDLGARTFDFYYGMADWAIGSARLTLGETDDAEEPAESAA